MTGPRHSTRHEPCRSCGDPLLVCPSTVRRFVRCCGDCTHRTPVDDTYEDLFGPDWADDQTGGHAA